MCDAERCIGAQLADCRGTPATPIRTTSNHPSVIHEITPPAHRYAPAKTRSQCHRKPRVAAQTCDPTWHVEKLPATMPELTGDQIVAGLSEAMNIAAVRNTNDSDMPSWEDRISVFFSVSKPEIETVDYIKRLVRYAECSNSAFAIVLVYLHRLEKANDKLGITYYNMHRLLITALMLAAKMLDDRCYSNAHYARVGGISSVKEVNRLEIEMLILLDYKLIVTPEEYVETVMNVTKPGITRCPTPVNPTSQVPLHKVSSHVSQHAAPTGARLQSQISHKSYPSHGPYLAQHPQHQQQQQHPRIRSHQTAPPPILATGVHAERAFDAHSSNNVLNLKSFAEALTTLAIPHCSEKIVDSDGSCNIGRSEFLELVPTMLAAAAFNHADIKKTENLDVRGFRAALQILGIDLEYGHLFHYFNTADSGRNRRIGCEDFTTVLPAIVYDTRVNFQHMLTNFRKFLDGGNPPDYGLVGVTPDMASAAFAAVDSGKKGRLDILMFKNALQQHLRIDVQKNYGRVFQYFFTADMGGSLEITEEQFLAMFTSADMEASKNLSSLFGNSSASTEYQSIGEASQRPMSHTMVSDYNPGHGMYKFEAPGDGYQVLPLHDRQAAEQSGVQHSYAGVRSRVYR